MSLTPRAHRESMWYCMPGVSFLGENIKMIMRLIDQPGKNNVGAPNPSKEPCLKNKIQSGWLSRLVSGPTYTAVHCPPYPHTHQEAQGWSEVQVLLYTDFHHLPRLTWAPCLHLALSSVLQPGKITLQFRTYPVRLAKSEGKTSSLSRWGLVWMTEEDLVLECPGKKGIGIQC